MQTRSTTRKLANALAANSDVSNDCSAKNTTGQRSKIASSGKSCKSKDKVKVRHHKKSEEKETVPSDKVDVRVRKRRSQRLMTEEVKSVQDDKAVAEPSSSISSGEQRQMEKDVALSAGSKKNKPTKRAKEDATEKSKRVEVKKVKGVKKEKKEEKEKEKKVKKEKRANKIKEETEEERRVKVEVTSKEEADTESRPPMAKKIKAENGGEESVSKVKSVSFLSPKSDRKVGIIKREAEHQMQLLDVKKDLKNEDQSTETEEFSRSCQSEKKVVGCKKEAKEEEMECGPAQETQDKDSEPATGEESVNGGTEVREKEAASTSSPKAPKETHVPKATETVLQGFDIRIEKLSDDFINSVRDKKLVIAGSQPEQKKDRKKQRKEPCKRKILDDKNFIPLNTSGSTKFFVADMTLLKKSRVNHPAMDVKRDLLYGSRVKRVPYSKVLAYNMKNECRKMSDTVRATATNMVHACGVAGAIVNFYEPGQRSHNSANIPHTSSVTE